MSLEANRFRLGVFFFFGAVLVVGVLVWLTGWFNRPASKEYVCYFAESVQGLENGTAVRYNGVPVGKVQRIAVAPDGRLVEVTLTIETGFPVGDDLAARLDFVGITGVRVVNLRVAQQDAARLPPLSFRPPHQVIPVVESQLEKLDIGLQGLLNIMAGVDFARIGDNAAALLENLNRLTQGGSVDSLLLRAGRTASNLDSLITEYRALAARLGGLAQGLEAEAGPLAQSVRALAANAAQVASSLEGMPATVDGVAAEATALLREMRAAVVRVRDGTDMLFAPTRKDRWP